MIEITIHIPAVDRLADAIEKLAILPMASGEPEPLQKAAEAPQEAAEPVKEKPKRSRKKAAAPAEEPEKPAEEPTPAAPARTYTLEDVQKAAVAVADKGKGPALVEAIQQTFGVPFITEIPADRYDEAMDLFKAMGEA